MTTAYCDYTYYSGTYLGTAIASANFARLALRASAVIDSLTFNRAADETDTDTVDAIKMATCAVAEEIQAVETGGGADAIQSESVGSVSITYADNATKRLTNNERYTEAAKLYLGNTGLMFKGFMDGEYGCTIEDDDE